MNKYSWVRLVLVLVLVVEDDVAWMGISKHNSPHRTKSTILPKQTQLKGGESRSSVELQVMINLNQTVVEIDGKEIYSHNRNASNSIDFDHTTGIHLLILHQTTFRTLFRKLYFTAQPAADRDLLRRLANVHYGRIAVVIGHANFTFWFRQEAIAFFYDMGSYLGPEVAQGEFWVLVFRQGFSRWKSLELDVDYWDENYYTGKDPLVEANNLNQKRRKKQKKRNSPYRYMFSAAIEEENLDGVSPNTRSNGSNSGRPSEQTLWKASVLYEAVSTIRNYRVEQAPPFSFTVTIESEPEERCAWQDQEIHKDLAKFCSLYDGYKPFCRCRDRVPLLPQFGGSLPLDYEIIPVVIVTAERLAQVTRQVRKIRAAKGGKDVPILLCVDGFNPEAEDLAQLLRVPTIFHHNKFVRGTHKRINNHVAWSLRKGLEHNKNSNYTIILEDDLDLSPDFVRYFQQIAWLMDIDPSIIIANAYNYNAYPHTANDPTRLYIVQSYPYYGWMVRRTDAMKMLQNWTPSNQKADWDLYLHYNFLNGSYVIIPEVPRTKHIGGGGVHVSGYVQETSYNVRPMNKFPDVNITLERMIVKHYSLDLMRFLLSATILNITKSPCSFPPLSKEKPGGKFVLYLNLTGDADEAYSFTTVSECLGFDEDNMLEIMEATFFRKYFHHELLMVACPVSPYCIVDSNSPSIYTPTKEAIKDVDEFPFVHLHSEVFIRRRIHPSSLLDEINLDNFVISTMNLDD